MVFSDSRNRLAGWRIHLIFFLLFLSGVAIIGRLAFLQIVHHGFYKALAQGQQSVSALGKEERKEIVARDKNGNIFVLATNKKVPFVFVAPGEVTDDAHTAFRLSQILNIPDETIRKRLRNKESFFELLKRQLSEEEKKQILEENLKGVYIGEESARFYPHGTFASHLLGFVNKDGLGQYGVEEYFNDILEGKERVRKGTGSSPAYLLNVFRDAGRDETNLILTIDYNIQSMAETLLEKATEDLSIEEGLIIIMDPSSGRILALANFPAFDPNTYSKVKDFGLFRNPAVQKFFEPGSIFKAITMAAAIETGAVTPETTYEDKGWVQVGDKTIYNYNKRRWGERTMTEVLQFSINTGAVFAEKQLGHQRFLEYSKKFGIFDPTNIQLPGEVYSQNEELQRGYEVNFATASFGQGIEMTPIQLLRAFSAIANGGLRVEPSIVEGADNPSYTRIISPQTASQVTAMLVSVVENGFGKSARIPGYYIAGKTGTAQIPWSALGIEKPGYSHKTNQSFIGYAPAYNPKFLILVKLHNPKTKSAEYSAVPIFRELAKYMIDYYQIPPDYEP